MFETHAYNNRCLFVHTDGHKANIWNQLPTMCKTRTKMTLIRRPQLMIKVA